MINIKSPLLNRRYLASLTGFPVSTFQNRLIGHGRNKPFTDVEIKRIQAAISKELRDSDP